MVCRTFASSAPTNATPAPNPSQPRLACRIRLQGLPRPEFMARLRLRQRDPWSGDTRGDAGPVVRLHAEDTRFAPRRERRREVCLKRVRSCRAIQIESGKSFKISGLEDRRKFAQRLPRECPRRELLHGNRTGARFSHTPRVRLDSAYRGVPCAAVPSTGLSLGQPLGRVPGTSGLATL